MPFVYKSGWCEAVLDKVDLDAVLTPKQAAAFQRIETEHYREGLIEIADEYWRRANDGGFRKAADYLQLKMSTEQINSDDFMVILNERKR